MSESEGQQFGRSAELFKALANPTRLHLLVELLAQPMCVHDLAQATGASQPLVSQHLRVLRTARLIAGRRAGRETIYTVTDAHITHIVTDAIAHTNEEKL